MSVSLPFQIINIPYGSNTFIKSKFNLGGLFFNFFVNFLQFSKSDKNAFLAGLLKNVSLPTSSRKKFNLRPVFNLHFPSNCHLSSNSWSPFLQVDPDDKAVNKIAKVVPNPRPPKISNLNFEILCTKDEIDFCSVPFASC